MHAKTESDSTSLPGSSPTRSPARRPGPMYFVQSPSRESSSHDGEKGCTNSFNSTPVISPMGSPPHSHSNSSLGPHSRESSSTRFSGSAKDQKKGRGGKWNNRSNNRRHPFDAIEEESLINGELDEGIGSVSKKCWYFIWFLLGFFLLFSFFSLVLWGASRNQKPLLNVKSIKFEEFGIQAGLDTHGVPTAMASMNATLKMWYHNRGTFFGVHVTSTPLQLSFEDLIIGSGMMKYFYERRGSKREVTVQIKGDRVPLYGGALSLSNNNNQTPSNPLPLTLNFRVRSRAYVLGHLVKPKFYKSIDCSLFMDPNKLNKPLSLKRNCTYA